MFGLSVATELFQGSTERTWNCVLHFIHLIWSKLNHIRQPIMPRSRKRHHSHSRSRSRSHDRSHEREEKHRKNDSHEKDRDGKRRKIETFDSPQHKRSVSSEPDCHDGKTESPPKELPIDEIDHTCKDTSDTKVTRIKKRNEKDTNEKGPEDKINKEETTTKDRATDDKNVASESDTDEEVVEILDGDEDKCSDDFVVTLNDSKNEMAPSKEGSTLVEKLEITPKKVLSPKQLKRKVESERKRQEKQKEKEEKDKKRMEEKERIQQEKLKRKEEKQKELEQKQKEKEMKEEQRKKEREDKEELKRKEREEKEQKRKEKEEIKRKEREEKLKKQLEIEEKNKEKQREEEKKQKAAAAFVNFFVAKKTENIQEEKKTDVTQPSAFMPFQVKSDMKLPPARRKPLSEKEKESLVFYFDNEDETASYIKDLKSGKQIGKSPKTWPFEEVVDDDIAIVEDEGNLGETIYEDKLQRLRAKCLKFHENRRPAYFGTWRKKSSIVTPRRPFAEDKEVLNYEEDSDDDWEEEEQGESLNGSDDEGDKENEDEKDDYEVDNDFFVPHGHLSDDEIDDEATSKLSPESLKQKLKLLKDEFDHDMQSKTHKLKPRSIGCVWYNKDGSNVEEAINRYLQPLSMITNGQVQIKKRSEILICNTGNRKPKATKELDPEHIPMFLKVIHGNTNKKRVLVEQFMTHMANNGLTVDIKKTTIARHLKKFATWRRWKKNGPMKNKFGWFVNENVEKEYNVDLALPNILESDKK